MDTNAFIFTDDTAESLDSRTVDAEDDADTDDRSRPVARCFRSAVASIGGIGLGTASFLTFLDR